MCDRGACMAEGGMCGRGHVWQGSCVAGGMHGRGVCMVVVGGHAWQGACMVGSTCMTGACVVVGGVHGRRVCMPCMPPQHILQDTVNERAVRIVLECILVMK